MMAQSRPMGLISRLTFRVMLAAMALSCFVIALPQAYARYEITTRGRPATLQRASATTPLPTDWVEYEGKPRADFPVRLTSSSGETMATNLFLPEVTVRTLHDGGTVPATVVWTNPRRYLLDGDPLPSVGGGWLVLGALLSATFLYALRLK